MVIDFNTVSDVVINNQSMSKIYRNNILIWSKVFDSDDYPTFIASSPTAGTYYTYDGKKWKSNKDLHKLKFTCIFFYKGYAIAGTDGEGIYISSDGKIWQKYGNMRGKTTAIGYGNEQLMLAMVGDDAGIWNIALDQTGAKWQKETYTGDDVTSITFNGNRNADFFVCTTNGIWKNHNRNRWEKINNSKLNGFHWENIVYNKDLNDGNGIYVASSMLIYDNIGQIKAGGGIVFSEDNGNSWQNAVLRDGNGNEIDIDSCSWKTLLYSDGKFIANSVGGSYIGSIESEDGKTWHTLDNIPWNTIEYGNGLYIAACLDADSNSHLGLMYSRDMVEWHSTNLKTAKFHTVEYFDPAQYAYMTGTTLHYANTRMASIMDVVLTEVGIEKGVGMKF